MPKLKLTISLLSILLISFLFVILKPSHITAQTSTSDINYSERDLIALRILPNEDNLSIFDWYRQQGFTGSPQFLTVDGYEAIRDGRTVYINAANISGNKLYTNIYLISYNQEPDVQTIDIFGGIINNWKFNTNLDATKFCDIKTKICSDDSDCLDNETCDNLRCELYDNINCLTDNHCPAGYYCSSEKAKVIRDTKRLGIFNTLKKHLDQFYNQYSFYPILGAGSYIQYNTVSTWPSWQNQFLSPINASLNLVDPINSLGICAEEYDQHTCFNTDNSTFNNSTSTNIILPVNSYVFAYQGNNYGTSFNLCAGFETSYELEKYTSVLSDRKCPTTPFTNTSNNLPPIIETHYLQGEAYQEFNGFIRIKDPENHPIKSVVLINIPAIFGTWHSGQAPVIQDTNNPLQKRIYSPKAGDPNNYQLLIKTEDIYGAATTTNLTIKIGNPAPFIEIDSFDYYFNPSPDKPLQFTIKMTDKNAPISYTLVQTYPTGLPLITIGDYLTSTSTIGNTLYANYSRNIPTTTTITNDTTLEYRIVAEDSLGASSTHQFNINLKATPPVLDFVCPSQARVDQDYKCVLGKKYRGDFSINMTAVNLPGGISLSEVNDIYQFQQHDLGDVPLVEYQSSRNFLVKVVDFFKNIFNFQTRSSLASSVSPYYVLSGKPGATGTSNIIITATNNYGTFSKREMSIKVNDYCGDGLAQSPNSEGRGGYYNDGYEDCDMEDKTTKLAASSTVALQYACNTNIHNRSPYPILSGDHCVFKDPLSGGGFCGDGFCQTHFEYSLNCEEDCGPFCGYDVLYQGEYYPTVLIGEQCWFAKNLNVGTRINSVNNQGTSTVDIKKYCYDDENTNCDIYGGLYQWNQAMAGNTVEGSQGICPDGWHVPKDEYGWHTLEAELSTVEPCDKNRIGDGCEPAALELREKDWSDDDDPYNFTALASGFYNSNAYEQLGLVTRFWTSRESGNKAFYRHINGEQNTIYRDSALKTSAYPLRCVKDDFNFTFKYLLVYDYDIENGYINGQARQWVNEGDDGEEVEAIANNGYVFHKWSDDIQTATRTDISITEHLSVYPIFITSNKVSFDGNGGSCTPIDRTVVYGQSALGPDSCTRANHSLNKYFIAPPYEDRCVGFDEITGACDEVLGNFTVKPWWTLNSYSVNYSVNNNSQAYISGSTNQTVYHGDDASEVTVLINNPAEYIFTGWSGGVFDNPRKDTNVQSNINVVAQIEAFTCGDNISYRGRSYETIEIDDLCWLKENLNVGQKIDVGIYQGTSNTDIQKYCYENDEANCNAYGALYQWSQAMAGSEQAGSQGICPDGWYIPTQGQWDELNKKYANGFPASCFTVSGTCSPAGLKLKDTTFDGDNSSLFSILNSGYSKAAEPYFTNTNDIAVFWTSTKTGFKPSHFWYLKDSDLVFAATTNSTILGSSPTSYGLSVRCVKDIN